MEIKTRISIIKIGKSSHYLKLPHEIGQDNESFKKGTATFVIDDTTKMLIAIKDIKKTNQQGG